MESLDFKEWLTLNEAYYGNYCGPGPKLDKTCMKLANGEPLPEPINSVDATCRDHDLMYCRCGVDWRTGVIGNSGTQCSRTADRVLIRSLEKLRERLKGSEKLAGTVVLNYFKTHQGVQNQTNKNPPGGFSTGSGALALPTV